MHDAHACMHVAQSLDPAPAHTHLHQERGPLANVPLQGVAEVLEDLDELGANGLALGLRVRQALEARQHLLAVVHAHHGQVQVVAEHVHHAVLLLQAGAAGQRKAAFSARCIRTRRGAPHEAG